MQILGLDSWTWLLWLCPAIMGMVDLVGRLAGSGNLLERLLCPSQGGSFFFLPIWCLGKGVLPGSLFPALWKSNFAESDAFVWVMFFLWAGLGALGHILDERAVEGDATPLRRPFWGAVVGGALIAYGVGLAPVLTQRGLPVTAASPQVATESVAQQLAKVCGDPSIKAPEALQKILQIGGVQGQVSQQRAVVIRLPVSTLKPQLHRFRALETIGVVAPAMVHRSVQSIRVEFSMRSRVLEVGSLDVAILQKIVKKYRMEASSKLSGESMKSAYRTIQSDWRPTVSPPPRRGSSSSTNAATIFAQRDPAILRAADERPLSSPGRLCWPLQSGQG